MRSVGVANCDKAWISFNTSTGDNESQELSGWYAENAFFRIELDVICSEVVECEPQVVYQRVDVFGFDDHIVYVCLYYFVDLFLQTCLNHALICCAGVFEPKRHCVETEWAVWCDKCRYGLVGLHRLDLVVAGVCVEEAQ